MYVTAPAVIKAWLKTDSKQGIQRAVVSFWSLALNVYIKVDTRDNAMNNARRENQNKINDEASPTAFGRIARWGASLLGKCDEKVY